MSATLINYGSVSGLIDGRRIQVGTLDTPHSFVVAGEKHEQTVSIANGANAALYANSLGQFNTVAIECDFNTRILITDTENNSFNIGLRGTAKTGQYGHPLQITLGTTMNANVTINSIVAYNESGNTAKVHVLVVK